MFSYNVSMPKPAECHPDRAHLAKGLCASCYVTARQKRERATMSEEDREKRRAYFTAYRRVWREEHREQDLANGRKDAQKAYARDPVKHRHRSAAARYGITVPEYLALIAKGTCDACGEASDKTLEVDHCHDSGRIRGALCHNCNSALGHARDDVERLTKLVVYLNHQPS